MEIVYKYNNIFNSSLNSHLSSANKFMFAALHRCYKMKLPMDKQLELFEKKVEPTLLYSCEVWGSRNFKRLDIY